MLHHVCQSSQLTIVATRLTIVTEEPTENFGRVMRAAPLKVKMESLAQPAVAVGLSAVSAATFTCFFCVAQFSWEFSILVCQADSRSKRIVVQVHPIDLQEEV